MSYQNLRIAAVLLLALPTLASAQGGIIAGTVRDTANRPVAAADISVRPGLLRTRTDSAGKFILTGLGADKYTVRARKIGYGPTTYDVDLSHAGRVDISLVFDQSMPMLDTIKIVAGRSCSEWSLDGFVCRRKGGGGVFLDYTDIDDKEALYTADIFRDIKGFRTDVRGTRYGPVRYVRANPPWGCITQLVDGRPASPARPVPELPVDLLAVEVYARPDSVPKEYQKYTWPDGGITKSGRCSVINYWTLRARIEPR
ncbi:MAG: carboxypeptidase-like regulatory domain-containing protein [Gemmatimonadaceae bacterium]